MKRDEANLEMMQAEFRESFRVQVEEKTLSLESKLEHKKNLRAEIERLRNSDKRPQAIMADIATLDKDIAKFQELIKARTKQISVLDAKYEQLVADQESMNASTLIIFFSWIPPSRDFSLCPSH